MYDIHGDLIDSKTPLKQLGHPFKLFSSELLQLLLDGEASEPRPAQMSEPMAFQVKNEDFTPWLHFIPRRKHYDNGCLLYLVEADPLGTGDTLLKVGLTLETDPLQRDPKAYKSVLSQYQVPAGSKPMLVERLCLLACGLVGPKSDAALAAYRSVLEQKKRWAGYTELLTSTKEHAVRVFDLLAPRVSEYLRDHPETAALQEWNLLQHLWRVKHHFHNNRTDYGCSFDPYFDFEIKSKSSARQSIARRINRQLQKIADGFGGHDQSDREMALERIKRNFETLKGVGLYEQGYYYRETGVNLSGKPAHAHPNFRELKPMDESTIEWVLNELEKDPEVLSKAIYGISGAGGSVPPPRR